MFAAEPDVRPRLQSAGYCAGAAEGKPVVNIDPADKDPKIQRAKLDALLAQDRQFLQSIGPDHNFANLSGKDNAVLFYTNRYSEQPLVIKGAGAGADVTAAGVFADIIRASRS